MGAEGSIHEEVMGAKRPCVAATLLQGASGHVQRRYPARGEVCTPTFSRQSPEMRLSTPQCRGRPLPTKN